MIKLGLMVILMSVSSIVSPVKNTYTKEATVAYVKEDNVKVIDENKNLWDFKGTDFNKGEKIVLVMNSKGTKEITDDSIDNAFKK